MYVHYLSFYFYANMTQLLICLSTSKIRKSYYYPNSVQNLASKISKSGWQQINYAETVIKKRINRLGRFSCKNYYIKIVFTSFKIGSWFIAKYHIPSGLRSRIVYKFSCAGCKTCCIKEVYKHLTSDKTSHIYKHGCNWDFFSGGGGGGQVHRDLK